MDKKTKPPLRKPDFSSLVHTVVVSSLYNTKSLYPIAPLTESLLQQAFLQLSVQLSGLP